jgi:hypothetical protein
MFFFVCAAIIINKREDEKNCAHVASNFMAHNYDAHYTPKVMFVFPFIAKKKQDNFLKS